jgi:hypothetical protein
MSHLQRHSSTYKKKNNRKFYIIHYDMVALTPNLPKKVLYFPNDRQQTHFR